MGINAWQTLRREYPGDEAWAGFVAAFKEASTGYRRAQASALVPADADMGKPWSPLWAMAGRWTGSIGRSMQWVADPLPM